MKKFVALMIALMALVCCVSAVAAPSVLSKEEAMQAALDHIGLTNAKVTFTEVHQDLDDGCLIWEIEFIHDGVEYEFDIDAHTGKILEMDITRHASHDLDFLFDLI